jgi:hypothetical protein
MIGKKTTPLSGSKDEALLEIKKSYSVDALRFVVELVILVIALVMSYGLVQKDIAVMNEQLKQKVSQVELFERLNQMEDRITKKIDDLKK